MSTQTDHDCDANTALLGTRIADLWDAERCDWKLLFEDSIGADSHGWWNVYLEWTSEGGNPHSADFVTYTWTFYACSAETAMFEAVAWLEALAPWKPCDECDGQGVWNGVPCVDCKQTGLANA